MGKDVVDVIIDPFPVLFLQAHLQDGVDESLGTAVPDGGFSTVHFDIAVVDLEDCQGGQHVFDRRHTGPVLCQGGCPGRGGDQFCRGPDLRMSVQICPDEDDSRIRGRRLQRHTDELARMQAHTVAGDRSLKRMLFLSSHEGQTPFLYSL